MRYEFHQEALEEYGEATRCTQNTISSSHFGSSMLLRRQSRALSRRRFDGEYSRKMFVAA
jgi:hypothetical protein